MAYVTKPALLPSDFGFPNLSFDELPAATEPALLTEEQASPKRKPKKKRGIKKPKKVQKKKYTPKLKKKRVPKKAKRAGRKQQFGKRKTSVRKLPWAV